MVEFFTDENGKPVDIRRLAGRSLRYFAWPQGACSDGKYIYMIFERKRFQGRTHRCKIVKLDLKTLKVIKVSDELKIGHGNDITYCNGNLYVTHSAGGRVVHRIDPFTLKYKETIRVVIPKELGRKKIREFNGIACYGSGFILRIMWGSGMLITDENFHALRHFRTRRFFKTSQGMDQKSLTTYRAFSKLQSSDRNYLVTFDEDGRMLERIKLEVTGELENVFFAGDQLYGTVYRRSQDSAGSNRRSAYVFKVY